MENMEKLKEMLCEELEAITKRGDISHSNLDTIHKLVVTIEKLDRIEEIEGGEDYSQAWEARGGYSRGRYSREDMSRNSYRNDSYADGSYADGNSYARRGQHYVRGHYSRAGEDMGEIIEGMMENPNTPPKDKETLRKAMEILNR